MRGRAGLLTPAPAARIALERGGEVAGGRHPRGRVGVDALGLTADEIETLRRVARERGTTYILIGPPKPSRGLGRLNEPLVMRILRALPDLDVRIVAVR